MANSLLFPDTTKYFFTMRMDQALLIASSGYPNVSSQLGFLQMAHALP